MLIHMISSHFDTFSVPPSSLVELVQRENSVPREISSNMLT